MRKFVYAVGAVVLILAVAGGFMYARNESEVRVVAEKALNEFRATNRLGAYKRRAAPAVWIENVRTSEGDAAAEIRNASRLSSSAPDGASQLALLEEAGARKNCNLTGGVIPIATNPFETETLDARGLLALGKTMTAKAKALEGSGLRDDAQRELLLLLSVGAHLEGDCSWTSFSLGLALQETALEALQELYAGRGEEWAKEAAEAGTLRAALAKRREAISPTPPLMEVSLSKEGVRVLGEIAEDGSLEKAIRAEAILALNAGHLFHRNRIAFGPETERTATVRDLRLEDPVLAEVSAKAQSAILAMSLSDRRKAVSKAYVLR